MGKYASKTKVPVNKSRDEIEKTLDRYGADQFIYGWNEELATVAFRMNGRQIKISLPNPDPKDFQLTETGQYRSEGSIKNAMGQEKRQRWRALLLIVKAKLEAIDCEIASFEDEFLAYTMLPDGSTAGEYMKPQINAAYETGNMPQLLPNYSGVKNHD